MDNIHTAVGVHGEADTLVLEFDEGQTLSIEGADGIDFAPTARSHRLTVKRGRRVRWTWYYYGRSKVPENMYVEEHWFDGNSIEASSTADWCEPAFSPSPNEPGVSFV